MDKEMHIQLNNNNDALQKIGFINFSSEIFKCSMRHLDIFRQKYPYPYAFTSL